jgi:para-aminobenzoate synthetase component 1
MTAAPHSSEDGLPLVEELRPAPNAWEVCRRLSALPHLLFLDSALVGSPLGRYSFVAVDPFAWLHSRRGDIHWSLRGVERRQQGDPLLLLGRLLADWRTPSHLDLPPFQGGAAGLFGYDLCHHIERLPRPRFDEFAAPDLAVGFYDCVVAFDHVAERAWLVSTGLPESGEQSRRRRARARLAEAGRWLEQPLPPYPDLLTMEKAAPALAFPVEGQPRLVSTFDRPGYEAAVRRVVRYIHDGDCYQVNLSQRLLQPATLPPLALYERLRTCNPAPFAGYFDLGDFAVVSASPERFLRVEAGRVETRPIKGTRPRGATPEEDRLRGEELLASAKDRAENVMIVDLLRNDLGRVCAYGSVEVTALCQLETYRTVHHLVSEVRGRLRPDLGPVDLLRAAFPGGSVTGAPKVRAMQIIAELEPTARGPYCGSLGYIGFDGTMDASILIRTFTAGGGWLQFPVGGGVVADSDPAAEYAETMHKAEGMLRALG